MRKQVLAVVAAAGMVLGMAGTADAAPEKKGEAVTLDCPSGTSQAIVAPGQGAWVPAILTSSRGVAHPVGFEGFAATVYDAETDAVLYAFSDPHTEYRSNAFRHPHGFERCTYSFTLHGPVPGELEEGTYAIVEGTVLVRHAPPRR